jgi:PAS domain S-box-containing protein
MNILPLLHLLSLLACVYMAVFVLYKDPKSLLNVTCSILMLCFALWNGGDIFLQNPGSAITINMAILLENIKSVGWIGFASSIFCFSLAFSKREKLLKKKWFLFLVFILPLFFIYKQWTNCLTINPIRQSFGWSIAWSDTIWTYLFYAYYISFTLLSIYFIYRYGKKTEKLSERRQAIIIVASISIALFGGTISDVVIPELHIYSIPTLANFFVLIFAVGLVYTIIKYRFLAITPAVAAENIISAMDELLILLNQEGNILTINKATLTALQYEQKELIGKPVTMLFQEDSFKKIILENITKEEGIKNHDSYFLTKNEKKIPIIYSSSPLKNEEGIIIGTVLIARDITEHNLAEQTLKKSEEKFKNLVETTFDIIWETNEQRLYTYVSPQIEKILGYKQEEIIGHSPFDFMPADEAEKIKKRSDEIILSKKSFNGLISINLHKDGHRVILETSGVPVLDANNNLLGYRGIDRDITDRKQAEEAFHENESALMHAQEIAKMGSWKFDMVLNKINWSENLYRIFGLEPFKIEPTFEFFLSKIHPDDLHIIYEGMEYVQREKTSLRQEIRIILPDGSLKWMQNELEPGFKDDKLIMLTGVSLDITETKLTEIELREKEVQYHNLANSGLALIWTSGTDKLCTYVNEPWLKFTGRTFEQAIGNAWAEGVHPDDFDRCLKTYLTAFDNRKIFYMEYRYHHVSGEYLWISDLGTPNYNSNGQFIGYIGHCFDITEQKLAEIALIESENKYRLIAENTADVIWSLDMNLKFTFMSPSIMKLRGFTVEEAMMQSIDQVLTPHSLQEVLKIFAEQIVLFKNDPSYDIPSILIEKEHSKKDGSTILTDDQVLPPYSLQKVFRLFAKHRALFKNTSSNDTPSIMIEMEQYKKDGSIVLTENSISLLFDKKQAIGVLGITRNINERKHAEEELIKAKEKAEESDRLKSAFLANMSHEIRTPMNGILGFAELLKETNLKGEQQQEYIRIIEKSGVRMLNIINDIISISKVESGQMGVSVSETNINEQIEYIYTFFKPEAEKKGIQILFKNTLPDKVAIIKTDKEKVYAILTNLVKNAIKFTTEGFIELGYEKKDNYLEFFVKDTGTGIRQEQKEIIFERFRQGSESRDKKYEGAGLGLSISKAFVEMLGGTIWVESEEGKGSIFYFTIPYNAEQEEKNSSKNVGLVDGEKNQINNLKILIAEDDETSEILITKAVKIFGKEVLKAGTGVEVVEACRNNPDIDLILMDIQMPEMNGYEATRQIRQFNKDVVIIAQTAYALIGDREMAIAAGCNDYISKPIKKDELMALIQKYFNK